MGNFQLQPAPLRVPMFDAAGQMARPWLVYFQQLFALGGQVSANTATISEHADALASDAPNGVDVQAIAEEWTRRTANDPARDVSAAIESAAGLQAPDAARHTEPRHEETLAQATTPERPHVTRADLDELRALLAMTDAPQLTNLGSAAYASASAFDAAGAASNWTGDVSANSHNLSGVNVLGTSGLQVSNFLTFQTWASMNYAHGAATYMTSNNAGNGAWNEFSYFLNAGAALANDEFWISVNARSTAGGADNYAPALRIKALTGAVTLPNATTFSVAPTFTDAAGTRAALGLAASATTDTTNASNITSGTLAAARIPTLNQNTTGTAANVTGTVAIANGGTGATTAAAALSALGGASLGAANSYSGVQTFTQTNSFFGSTASGTAGNVQIQGGSGSPNSGRILFGTDGSGWQFAIGKNQGGTATNLLTVKDDGTATLSGNSLAIATSKTPATSAAAGTAGQICWDANYLYICVSASSWRRIALTTF